MASPLQTFIHTCEPWHGVDRAPMEQAYAERDQMVLEAAEKALDSLNRELGLTN